MIKILIHLHPTIYIIPEFSIRWKNVGSDKKDRKFTGFKLTFLLFTLEVK